MHDVVRAGAAGNQGRVPVDHAVPHLAGGVVFGIGRKDQLSAEGGFKAGQTAVLDGCGWHIQTPFKVKGDLGHGVHKVNNGLSVPDSIDLIKGRKRASIRVSYVYSYFQMVVILWRVGRD
jgi:hypothetical protein